MNVALFIGVIFPFFERNITCVLKFIVYQKLLLLIHVVFSCRCVAYIAVYRLPIT